MSIQRVLDKPFLLPIEDAHKIEGRGTVVTGRVERGLVSKGQEIEIVGLGSKLRTVVTGIEMFHKQLDRGEAGDNLGVLLRGVDYEAVKRGMVLAQPGSIKPHKKFKSQLYALTKDEGKYFLLLSYESNELFIQAADTLHLFPTTDLSCLHELWM